jgi:DNA invertase Pin-like site-specific DNA recombinase
MSTRVPREKALFVQALEIEDPEQRSQFLDQACGTDLPLREQVQNLLALSQSAGNFFTDCAPALEAAPGDAGQILAEAGSALEADETCESHRIGTYKLLQKLGEGGCGVVYMAEQEQPIRRRVALKIIKLTLSRRQKISSIRDMKTNSKAEGSEVSTVYSYLRWSSEAQTLGDSERRQLQQASDWCSRRGLKLSDRTFADRGVSAKAGKNLEEGALGELVRVAKPGDVLLIEDNDRFSRQSPITALSNLSAVVNKGISVVFLRTGVEVNQANFNDMGVIVPNFFGALLANQENEKRAFRIRQSWEKRYAELRSGKATRMKMPGWLKRDGDNIAVDQAKAQTVKRIFKLALEGWGYRRIAQALNQDNVPTISGQSDRWNGLSIYACVLRNPAVIGQYKLHSGETVSVYPPIVTEQEFYAVAANNKSSKAQRSAPVRAASACLVTGLVKCPACGGPMSHHSSQHRSGKVYKYLVCAQNKAGQAKDPGCAKRVSYEPFERSLLALLRESALLREAFGQQQTGKIDEVTAMRGELEAKDKKLNEMLANYEDTPSKAIAARVAVLEAEAEAMRAQLQQRESEEKAQVKPDAAYEVFAAELAEHASEPEFRERIKTCLRSVIEHIQFRTPAHYTVQLRGGGSLDVLLNQRGFLFNPSPRSASAECDGVIRPLRLAA